MHKNSLTYHSHCYRRIEYLLNDGHTLRYFEYKGVWINQVEIKGDHILVNGEVCSNEDLLLIVIERLEGKENEIDYRQAG